jgi:putative transcriptional regulator
MRERRKDTKQSLAGSLLLAHPAMRDPNFRRAVVLMSSHNAEGAMGVVLNRPLDKRLGEINGEFALSPLAGVALYSGGPVQPEQLLLVAWEEQADGFRLHFGVEPDKAGQLLSGGGVEVRAFQGYAGWGGGQVETELKCGTWVIAEPSPDLLSLAPDPGLWRTLLTRMGGEWALLANEPEDPGMN